MARFSTPRQIKLGGDITGGSANRVRHEAPGPIDPEAAALFLNPSSMALSGRGTS
jgi:hypothetical protein